VYFLPLPKIHIHIITSSKNLFENILPDSGLDKVKRYYKKRKWHVARLLHCVHKTRVPYAILSAHVRLVIHGNSKDGGDCTAANVVSCASCFMYYVPAIGIGLGCFELMAVFG
jgi:hypothetical protein